jgi:hypothetical protein
VRNNRPRRTIPARFHKIWVVFAHATPNQPQMLPMIVTRIIAARHCTPMASVSQ